MPIMIHPVKMRLPKTSRSPFARAGSLAALTAFIGEEDTELVHLPRSPPPGTAKALTRFRLLPAEPCFRADVRADPACAVDCAASTFGLLGAARDVVCEDVAVLIEAVRDAAPHLPLRLRMECVADDACRRFHQDRTGWRLIVTYRGEGTHWFLPETNEAGQAAAWDLLLLRGKRGDQVPRALHKSPPMPEGRAPRLVLVLDLPEAP